MTHPSGDDLVLAALGHPLAPIADHLASCVTCAHELDALTGTVLTARAADLTPTVAPPVHVWDRVVEQLNLTGAPDVARRGGDTASPRATAPNGSLRAALPHDEAPAAVTSPSTHRGRGRHSRSASRAARSVPRRLRLLAAAAVVAVAGGAMGVSVFAAGNSDGTSGPESTLTALVDGGDGSGRTTLTEAGQARTLQVDTDGLPAPSGFYEVWLLDPADGEVRALGQLDANGAAVLSVPPDVDLAAYDTVDISAEPDDGVPTHSGDSVLRGALRL